MSDIEDSLRRYRPVGPPPGLQSRILGEDRIGRTWPWAAAAAALLAATVVLQVAAQRLSLQEPAVALRPSLEELTALLGGGEEAQRAAELILIEQEARAALSDLNPAAITQLPESTQ